MTRRSRSVDLCLLSLLLGGASRVGCKPAPAPGPARQPPPAQVLRVEYAGCEAVQRGPACVLGAPRALTLWVSTTARQTLSIHAPDRAITPTETHTVAGGTRYRVTVPEAARRVAVRQDGAEVWELRLVPARKHPALGRARALRKQGEQTKAESLLRQELPRLGELDRVRAEALLARIALARGESKTAADGLEQTLAGAARLGLVSQAVSDALALSFLRTVNLRDFAGARRVLERARTLAAGYPEGLAGLPYYGGLAAWESGDVRDALRAFREAERRAHRLGLRRPLRHAQQQIALTLATLGRTKEALQRQRLLLRGEAEEAPCARADLHTNLAWIASLGRPPSTDPAERDDPVRAHLARASQLLEACPDPFRRRNALINEALWALRRAEETQARQRVERLSTLEGGHNVQHAIWEEEVRGRLALAEGKPRGAIARFERQRELASASSHAEGLFRAESGLGRAAEQLGRDARAAAAYRRAERVLTRWLEWVPFSEGRDAFLGDRDLNARRLVDTLVRLDKPAEAATAARLARARLLRATTRTEQLARLSPSQRQHWDRAVGRYRKLRQTLESEAHEDWTLAADALASARVERQAKLRQIRGALDDAFRVLHGASRDAEVELRAPEAGELQLIYFPGATGWTGFAATSAGTQARRLGALEVEATNAGLSRKLLEPFRAPIARAKRLAIYPYGALQHVDFHALPWDGAALLARAPVVYSTDTTHAPGPSHDRLRRALVVGDPQGDLPHALGEAKRTAKALEGLSPTVLLGQQATRAAALRALPQADLFHYAGHATFGGTEGADSALLLLGGSRISLGDVLALPRVPQVVILSACESAKSSAEQVAGSGLGLANAFVAAGARIVIAPTRPVQDSVARALTAAMYAEGLSSIPNLGAALRTAQIQLAEAKPDSDWASFRILRP